jgi:hypothetical protein
MSEGWRSKDLVYQRGWQEAIEAADKLVRIGDYAGIVDLAEKIRALRPNHHFAGIVTVDRHDAPAGYAPMDGETDHWQCSCGEQFNTRSEFESHLEQP